MNLRLWECGELIQISTSTGGEQYIVIKFVTCFVVSFFGFDRAFRYLLTRKRVVKPLLQLVRRNRFSAYDVSPANAVPVNICLCHIFQTRVLVSEQALERVLGGWGGHSLLSWTGCTIFSIKRLEQVAFFSVCKTKQIMVKIVSCLKQGSEMNDFCLKQQGRGLKASAAKLYTDFPWLSEPSPSSGLICG